MKDNDKEFVLSFLQISGFDVELVPKLPPHQTPDLRVMLPEGNLLIEVKSKNDDQQFRTLLSSPKGTPFFYNPSTLRIGLHTTKGQIRNSPVCEEADLALIWFVTRRVGGVTVLTEPIVMGLLYGTASLEGYTAEQEDFFKKECFFLHESIFCKHTDLDAVVIHDDQSKRLKLCLNPFSPRYGSFQRSQFANLFRDQFTIVDPNEMEAAGECFIADCAIERDGTQETTQYVGEYVVNKYGLKDVKEYVPVLVPWQISGN